jgi:hypothetical protein
VQSEGARLRFLELSVESREGEKESEGDSVLRLDMMTVSWEVCRKWRVRGREREVCHTCHGFGR